MKNFIFSKTKKTISIAISLIIAGLTLPWVLMFIGTLFLSFPATPVNKYGEFPFRVIYEINGEQIVIDDVLICKYAGRGMDTGSGNYLVWNEDLASGKKLGYGALWLIFGQTTPWRDGCSIKLIDNVDVGKGLQGGIYIDIGNAQYYLGYYKSEKYSPGIVFNNTSGYVSADTLMEKYGVRIMEVEFPRPLEGNGILIKK